MTVNYGMYEGSVIGENKALTPEHPSMWEYCVDDLSSFEVFKEKFGANLADYMLGIAYDAFKEHERVSPINITKNRAGALAFTIYANQARYNYICHYCRAKWGDTVPDIPCCEKRVKMIRGEDDNDSSGRDK